jgi:hypothetical protein
MTGCVEDLWRCRRRRSPTQYVFVCLCVCNVQSVVDDEPDDAFLKRIENALLNHMKACALLQTHSMVGAGGVTRALVAVEGH